MNIDCGAIRASLPDPVEPPAAPLEAIRDGACVRDGLAELIPALRAFALKLTRNRSDADDLLQETLLKALRHAEKFRPGTQLRAWLFTIMRNTFYTAAKRRGREGPGAAEDCAELAQPSAGAQEWNLRGREVREAIQRLPRHYREMLVLVVMQGESYETGARLCGVSVGTVKSRVNRARRLVMEDLGDHAI